MALQQLSSGGASGVVTARDATSQAAQNPSGFNLDDYNAHIKNLAAPVIPTDRGTPQLAAPPPANAASIMDLSGAVTPQAAAPTDVGSMGAPAPPAPFKPIAVTDFTGAVDSPEALGFTGAWDGAKTVAGNPYAWDPFSFAGAGEGQALQGEQGSPGYKDFGDTWLDLLNTVSSQNLQWGGTNQYPGELKGGGSVGPWLSENIVSPWSGGDQKQAYDNALYFISSQTGKPPSDPGTQQMAGAFLEYTLQNDARYTANTKNFEQRRASEGGDKGIFGPLMSIGKMALVAWQPELAPFVAAESFAESAASGNTLGMVTSGLSALGGGFSNLADLGTGWADMAGLAGDADLLGNLGDIGSILSLGSDIGGGIGSLASGDVLGALGSGVSLVGGADKLFNSNTSGAGTSGSNATESGGIMGSLASSLDLTPEDLSKNLGYLMGAGKVAGAAIPLINKATEPELQIPSNLQAAATPQAPPAAATGPAFEAKPAGEAMARQDVYNPAAARYRAPGPRQANPTADAEMAARVLQMLGMPA